MSNSSSQNRIIAARSEPLSRDCPRVLSSNTPNPVPVDEIECLLRSARKNLGAPKDHESVEELGPGDVQYLRGLSMTPSDSTIQTRPLPNWPDTTQSPDSLLDQAEQKLAEAILDSRHDQRAAISRPFDLAANSIPSPKRTAPSGGLTLDDLGEVDLDITIELGRTEILIEDILKLREGSVVSLDKLAGDPVDIIANGRLVARGELLVIDGKFGVRLSEVL